MPPKPPAGGGAHTPADADHTITQATDQSGSVNGSRSARQWRARHATSRRLPVLDCGRPDPWSYEPQGEHGYEDAALHLLAHGLTPGPNPEGLRLMWRHGGHSRQAAAVIAQAWQLVA